MKKIAKDRDPFHQNWIDCDVLALSENFYGLFEGSDQYERVSSLFLSNKELERLFIKPKGKLVKICVEMGLDRKAPTPHKMSFKPLMTCHYEDPKKNPKPAYFTSSSLIPLHKEELSASKSHGAAIIPNQFKDTLMQNWKNLDNHLLDDAFVANKKTKIFNETGKTLDGPKKSQRLLGYCFTADNVNAAMLEFIQDCKEDRNLQLKGLILNLGLDFNKYYQKHEFSFSPIFEIELGNRLNDKQVSKVHKAGARVVEVDAKHYVYYEYISPCPPTCPD